MKKITTLFSVMVLFLGILQAQSTFDKVLIDFELPADNLFGVHGVAVAPDGNVWLALYGPMTGDTLFTTEGDTLDMRPIYVLDPNTGDHVSFSPIRFLEWADGTIDTLINSCRGIEVDNDGNLLMTGLVGSNSIVRVDYTNGKPLGKWVAPNTGSMTEAAQALDGNIYVTHVVPSGKPLYMLDNDLNFVANAVDSVFYINRTVEVSPSGNDIYTGSIYTGFGITRYHSDSPGLFAFTPVDTLGNWFNVPGLTSTGADTTFEKITLWASCLDFAPDGLLWAGMLDDGESGGHGKGSRWYAFDVTTGQLVDSIGIPRGDSTAGGFYRPRGAAWSVDGTKMYLADFNYNNVVVYNYNSVTSVKEINSNVIPSEISISQNYPNPFNPTTQIKLQLNNQEDVKLKIYNLLGQEVATLLNESMAAGVYEINFDASKLSSGVYIYAISAGKFHDSKKMTLLK